MNNEAKTTATKAAAAASFTKDALLSSKKHKDKRDLLSALLEDSITYTRAEVDKLVDDYIKKETDPVFKQRTHGRRADGRGGKKGGTR